MKESTSDINEIIIRYLDGSAVLEEKMLLLRWLKQSDGNRDDFAVTRDLWLSCNVAAGNELEVDIALEKLKDRILLEQGRMEKESLTERKTLSVVLRWTRVAAVLLLLLGIGYGIGSWREHSVSDVIVQSQLITAKGSIGRFTLPDGSVVWLNSETKLTYPNQFTGNRRFVFLEGEAYFEVAKDANKPFIVHTDQYNVRVLGTEFNVKSKSGYFETALLKGSIEVFSGSLSPMRIKNGERLYSSNDKLLKGVITDLNYFRWREGLICFEKEKLISMFAKLESYYDVHIILKNRKFLDLEFTGCFYLRDGVEHILRVLQHHHYFTYTKEDNENTIIIE